MNKKKNVLIIGGSGFIGYHMARLLIKKNFCVSSISKKKPKLSRTLKKVNYLIGDITKIKNLYKLKHKFSYVINLGGNINHSFKKSTYNNHFIGCVNLYKIFVNTKIKSFIQIGSSLEYGDVKSPQHEKSSTKPLSVYGKSKLLATKFLLEKYKSDFFPVVIIRPYQVYGPRQDNNRLISFTISSCLKNKLFACTNGYQKRDFLYVEDLTQAIYKALKNKKAIGNIINLGFGKPFKVRDIILKIKKIINKGQPKFNALKLRKDETKILYPSIKKAKNILNWKPRTNLLFGLKKTIKDYKNNL